jgi:hypothetical protein
MLGFTIGRILFAGGCQFRISLGEDGGKNRRFSKIDPLRGYNPHPDFGATLAPD